MLTQLVLTIRIQLSIVKCAVLVTLALKTGDYH